MGERKADERGSITDVLAFWLAAGRERWFDKNDVFDAEIRERFQALYEDAAAGLLGGWEDSPDGALALVILLDRLSRNMFRGSARCYAADPLARAVAARAIARGFDRQAAMPGRGFFYLPFEHSEELADQERCLSLARETGDAEFVHWAEHHAGIIRRFGRFPHRNSLLGRATTPDEQTFLDNDGFSG